MTKVLAAIDGTAVSAAVLGVAKEAARVLGAEVEAVHATGNGATPKAHEHALEAGVALRLLDPPVADTLVAEASGREVAAVVVGLRRTIGGATPAGHVALDVIRRSHATVVAVPPATTPRFELRRVLVPVQEEPGGGLENVVRIARDAHLDVIVLHVHDERSIPSFEDQSYYDVETWGKEFLARWVPGATRVAEMEVRVGTPEEQIMRCSRECGADMIAIGWSQDLSPGRANVVRAALGRSPVPVALLPLRVRDGATA